MSKPKGFYLKIIAIIFVVAVIYGAVGLFFQPTIPEGTELSLITLRVSDIESIKVNNQKINFKTDQELKNVVDALNDMMVIKEEVTKKDEVMKLELILKREEIIIMFGQNYVEQGDNLFSIKEQQVEDFYNLIASYS